MKKMLIQLFVIVLLFSQTTMAFARSCCNNDASNNFQPCEKIYVQPEQVVMSSKGIFVKLDDQWFQTETLLSDAVGIFIQNLDPSAYGCPDPYNACRNCGRCVHEVYDICPYCEKPA